MSERVKKYAYVVGNEVPWSDGNYDNYIEFFKTEKAATDMLTGDLEENEKGTVYEVTFKVIKSGRLTKKLEVTNV